MPIFLPEPVDFREPFHFLDPVLIQRRFVHLELVFQVVVLRGAVELHRDSISAILKVFRNEYGAIRAGIDALDNLIAAVDDQPDFVVDQSALFPRGDGVVPDVVFDWRAVRLRVVEMVVVRLVRMRVVLLRLVWRWGLKATNVWGPGASIGLNQKSVHRLRLTPRDVHKLNGRSMGMSWAQGKGLHADVEPKSVEVVHVEVGWESRRNTEVEGERNVAAAPGGSRPVGMAAALCTLILGLKYCD